LCCAGVLSFKVTFTHMIAPKIIRAAIIGCGSYASQHAQFLSKHESARIRAVCDIDESRAENFQKEYGADYVTTDVAKLWADPDIDAVWICIQHHLHAPFAIAAAEAGKNFFLEKPLAITMADCDRIVEVVERTGVTAMSGFKLRFFPAVIAAKEFLTKPTLTVAQVIDDHWPSEVWANDPIKGGGNVLSQGCHMMDTVMHMHPSPPVRVYAAGGNMHHPECDIVDVATITLTFADGNVANVSVGDVGVPAHTSKFALQQSDGERSVSLYNRLNSLITRTEGKETELPAWPEEGAGVIDTAFIKALAEGTSSPVTVQSARRTTAVVLAAIESIKTGQVIDLTTGSYAYAMEC